MAVNDDPNVPHLDDAVQLSQIQALATGLSERAAELVLMAYGMGRLRGRVEGVTAGTTRMMEAFDRAVAPLEKGSNPSGRANG